MEYIYTHTDGFNNILQPREGDLGFDLIAADDPIFEDNYIEYNTGVKIEPKNGDTHLLIFPRSSISKTNLILANHCAIIDNSYRGEIKLRFRYLPTLSEIIGLTGSFVKPINQSKIYQKGDKIAQGVFFKALNARLVEVDSLRESVRNAGGFGSTGK
jgi:dUTPase